jgi:hypothetical protein
MMLSSNTNKIAIWTIKSPFTPDARFQIDVKPYSQKTEYVT